MGVFSAIRGGKSDSVQALQGATEAGC